MASSKDPAIRIRRDLYEELKRRADDGRFDGVSMTGLVEEALENWLAAKSSQDSSDSDTNDSTVFLRDKSEDSALNHTSRWSSSERRAHALLQLILRSGIKEASSAITSSLEAFGMLVGAITGVRNRKADESGSDAIPDDSDESVAELVASVNELIDGLEPLPGGAEEKEAAAPRRTPKRRAG